MIIGINGNEANVSFRVGVNQYAYELLWAINKLQDKYKIKHKFIVFLRNKPQNDMPPENSFFKYRVIEGNKLWILKKLTPHLLKNSEHLDIFFSPNHYVAPFCRIKQICSIMDLGYLEFSGQFKKSQYWQLKLWSAYSMYISKAIIAISNSTKKDIMRHYKFAGEKTHVTLLAYDPKKFNRDILISDVRRIKNKYSIVDDYILFLSTLKPSKNVEGLIRAFDVLVNKEGIKNTKLVIGGKKGWLYESIFSLVKKFKLEKMVIFTDYVPEEDKPALFGGAKVFVLPSFWEGFGLDVLNAMACGVPCVLSSTGSLPEVGGNAAFYVDPNNHLSIAEGIKKILLADQKDYNTLREMSFRQAGNFSWEKTAIDTIKIFEKMDS